MYSELFGDWLHFRPKTPDDELDVYGNFGEEFPQFAENASLSVDIQRITESNSAAGQSTSTTPALTLSEPSTSKVTSGGKYPPKLIFDRTDNTFKTNPFTYEYLQKNTPKFETYTTSSTRYDEESSADELNLSGDGLSLSLGDNEANDKAIDTLLEECNGKQKFLNNVVLMLKRRIPSFILFSMSFTRIKLDFREKKSYF